MYLHTYVYTRMLKKAQTGSTATYIEEITMEVRDLNDITKKEDMAEAISSEVKELDIFHENSNRAIFW